jgi:hypothetical protein
MFSVEFRCSEYDGCVVRMAEPIAGLRALDAARNRLGADIVKIERHRSFVKFTAKCSLNEEQARMACSRFADSWDVTVVVPAHSLNRYVVCSYVRAPGTPTCARIDCDVDTERLINDWIASGAPLEWEPPETASESSSS